jgi:HlyD family secretion protein
MKNLWDRIRQNRWLSIGLVAALLLALWFVFVRDTGGTQLANLQTETAARGNLTATIGATGTVRAAQSAALTWKTAGTVEEVGVAVGDHVQAGDQLARLEAASLPQNVILAQADLESARDQLESFYDSYGASGLAQAQQTLANAQDAVDSARRRLSYLGSPATDANIDQAYANLILAEQQLDTAQDDFENYANRPQDDYLRASAQSRLSQAQASYNSAERTYNALINPAGDIELAIAQADLAVAEAQLEQAQEDLDEIVDGPTLAAIAAAESRVIAAEATLAQAYIQAPFDGVVTDAYPTTGDLVSTGSLAFQVDDLDNLLVDIEVSEVDVNRLSAGQSTFLVFDAVPEREYEGQVIAVALSGAVQQGAVNFRVTVQLIDADEQVRPGMTAAVNIVVTELQDVLLVPNRAVRVRDGERVVYILQNGQQQPVAVELGASSDAYSEVLSGNLQEGDTIILNPVISAFDPAGGPPQGLGGDNGDLP